MFKGLQWKMVTIFVLLVLAIMAIAGTFLILSVTESYHQIFTDEMDSIFTDSFIEQLETGTRQDEAYVKNVLSAFTVRMGINSYRNYYILRVKTVRLLIPRQTRPKAFRWSRRT